MTLRQTIKSHEKELKGLNIDTFGEVMDEFIQASRLGMLITKEKNTKDFNVQGVGCGAVMDFYIFLNALPVLFRKMLEEMDHKLEAEKLAEALCAEMRKTLIETAKEEEEEGLT